MNINKSMGKLWIVFIFAIYPFMFLYTYIYCIANYQDAIIITELTPFLKYLKNVGYGSYAIPIAYLSVFIVSASTATLLLLPLLLLKKRKVLNLAIFCGVFVFCVSLINGLPSTYYGWMLSTRPIIASVFFYYIHRYYQRDAHSLVHSQ